VLALAFAACASALAETPADYAYRIPLAVPADAAFVRVALPADVYERAVRADLGDVRVFDARGAPVAFAFLPPPQAAREPAGTASLALFPLRVDAASDLRDVAITIRKDGARASVDIATRDGRPVAPQRLAGYLVDASEVAQPIDALLLQLVPGGNVTTRVRLEASDDLSSWRTVAADAALIDVEYAGRRLVRNRVELPRTRAKYLRVSWAASQPAPELDGASAEYGERLAEPARQWRSVAGVAVGGKPGEFAFDVDGAFPADRATLVLAQVNTVAPAHLLARASASDEWRAAGSGVFYRLRHPNGDVENAPIAVSGPARRHWLVRVDPRAAIAEPPQLSLGWHPHVIVFAARGSAPFVLAYGRAASKPAALAIDTLVPGYDRATFDAERLPAATAGAVAVSAGDAALREPIAFDRWALWAVLAAAALMLAWMAVRLGRRLGRPAE
jgi:hypothetical protein